MFRLFNRSLSQIAGIHVATQWSNTTRFLSTIRTALATGHRRGLLLVTVLLGLLAIGARAQTASFNYAVTALGGGFSDSFGVAVDAGGNVYVANYLGNSVTEMPAGCASSSCVTTLGGGFSNPTGLAVDGSGNVYVADSGHELVEKMPPGCASSSCVSTLGGGFAELFGVAVDQNGTVYVADTYNNAVKKMPATCTSSSCVTTLGGGFSLPSGLAVDGVGNVYVADTFHNAVKEMANGCGSSSCVTTLGGGFNQPFGVAVDGSGNIFVADDGNDAVKEMPAGCASSSCVTALGGFFGGPQGLTVDGSGNVYAADSQNDAVKEIMTRAVNFLNIPVGTPSAALTLNYTVDSAGSLSSTTPYQVLTEGAKNLDFEAAATQEPNACSGTTPYTVGETCTINLTFTPAKAGPRYGAVALRNAAGSAIATTYIYGTGAGPQVAFSPATQSTLGGGFIVPQGVAVDGSGNIFTADSDGVKEMPPGCASSSCVMLLGAGFRFPDGVAVDGGGNIYIADTGTGNVKEMPAGCASLSCVTTLGGDFFSSPNDVKVDGSGNIYVADLGYATVEEMPAGCASSSCVTALGGGFNQPSGVAVDASGNVYVADFGNLAVKEMPAGCASSNCVTALGGRQFGAVGVAVDASGNVYVADLDIEAVYEMPAGCASPSCVTTLVSGSDAPAAVALDGSGNVYFSDTDDNTMKEINRATPPSMSLPNTMVGSSSSEFPQTVQVVNIGNKPLTFPAPESGTNPSYPANFPENPVNFNLCASGTPLAQGKSCDVSLSFAPTAAGVITGSVLLTDDNLNLANATQSIALSGIGIGTQTITFPPPSSPIPFPVSPITLLATGGASGNPVIFSVISGPGTVSGTDGATLTITGTGTVVVAANQAASADYTAATQVTQSIVVNPPATAVLVSPTPGSQFASSSVTFTWIPGAGVTNYWLNLGTAASGVNAKNIYSSGSVTVLTETVTALPTNGETIYATLYSQISGVFQPTVYTFYATGPAALTTPSPTTKLTASTTFTWTPGTGITTYWLNVGTAATSSNAKDIYSSGPITTLTKTVTGIPTYGATLYVTLYSLIAGVYQPIVYTYTASGSPVAATLTTPTPSTKLTSSSAIFTWSPGEGVTYYWFNLGTANSGANAKNIYSSGSTTLTSANVTGLPTNGETVYATLYSHIAGAWQPKIYTYTASGTPTPAVLTTPTPATQLTSSTVTFTWSPGNPATNYWFNIGTASSGANTKNIYAGSSTTATSVTVTGLPTNGETIYATLYSYIDGAWQPTVYTYKAQ